MEMKSIVSCTQCGTLFDSERFRERGQEEEGTDVYSQRIKEKYAHIKGAKFEVSYSGEYFFCPVCGQINKLED